MSAVSDFEKNSCNKSGCTGGHDMSLLLCVVALVAVFALFGNA